MQPAQVIRAGKDGCDVSGYRNYRGSEVVGAWAWLPEYGMGVATDSTAGERERGSLEPLLINPVPRWAFVAGRKRVPQPAAGKTAFLTRKRNLA